MNPRIGLSGAAQHVTTSASGFATSCDGCLISAVVKSDSEMVAAEIAAVFKRNANDAFHSEEVAALQVLFSDPQANEYVSEVIVL